MHKIYFLFLLLGIAVASKAQDEPGTGNAQAASYIEQGNAKADNGDWTSAVNLYSSALALDPKNEPAYCRRGIAQQNLKNYRGALVDFSKAIYLDNSDGAAFYGRAMCYYNMGSRDKCCFDLTKAIELGNNDAMQAQQNYCN